MLDYTGGVQNQIATTNNLKKTAQQQGVSDNGLVLRKGTHERTAGPIAVWEKPQTAKQHVEQQIEAHMKPAESFDSALSYAADRQNDISGGPDDQYGFDDVLDVVNPLQHVPLVSNLYRGITGDEIKPMSRIVGGALYGGPVGAVSGVANVILEHETGHDLAGHAMEIVNPSQEETTIAYSAFSDVKEPFVSAQDLLDHPEQRLDLAVKQISAADKQVPDLPGTALAFSDLSQNELPSMVKAANGRTAGMHYAGRNSYAEQQVFIPASTAAGISPRDQPLTHISMSAMPPEIDF